MSYAVVRLRNWQRSSVLADWAKNPDKPPIFENPPRRPDTGQKKRTCPGKPGRMVTRFLCLLHTTVSCAKTAEPMEMPFSLAAAHIIHIAYHILSEIYSAPITMRTIYHRCITKVSQMLKRRKKDKNQQMLRGIRIPLGEKCFSGVILGHCNTCQRSIFYRVPASAGVMAGISPLSGGR